MCCVCSAGDRRFVVAHGRMKLQKSGLCNLLRKCFDGARFVCYEEACRVRVACPGGGLLPWRVGGVVHPRTSDSIKSRNFVSNPQSSCPACAYLPTTAPLCNTYPQSSACAVHLFLLVSARPLLHRFVTAHLSFTCVSRWGLQPAAGIWPALFWSYVVVYP